MVPSAEEYRTDCQALARAELTNKPNKGKTIMQTMTQTIVPNTSTLPDGDTLGNDILAQAGKANTAKLLRATGQVRKTGKGAPPRVNFQPRGWTMGGRVD